MRDSVVTIATLMLVVVAGCIGPLGPSQSPNSPTPTDSVSPTDHSSPETSTPTPGPAEGLPPGVTSDGIENASRLLEAHVDALSRTGFVGVGAGNGTIYRDGFLVDVESNQRNVMAPNGSAYLRERTVNAGPVRSEWEAWGNASTEYRRSKEGDGWSYTRKEPAPTDRLAGRGLLHPYLRGGDFTITETDEDGNATRIQLEAAEADDPEALMEALPDEAERVISYEATVVVDDEGRIHSVRATVEYVIRGQEATHHLKYDLEQVDGITIVRPDWVDTAQNETTDG